MPSLGVYLNEENAALVEKAVKDRGEEKLSPYIAEAVMQRLEREGYLPGTPAFDVRAEAASAAEIAGPDAVLKALRSVKAEAAANAA